MTKLIEIDNASVTYRIRHGASPTLKETIIRSIKRQKHDVEVKALSDLSFTVTSGEVLAVIGRNGAGKSTLLKLLARVLPPTSGRVQVKGSVAPMIELGAGFNGELTGRENVILYGTLLGRSPKVMESRVNQIAEWADLTPSIDLPLRTYSSGMVAKLAFSVATDDRSDVILVDEVLSVGDAEFQERSKARLRDLFQRETAVVLVTHEAASVRELATKAIWINHGKVMKYGEVNSVLDAYLNA